MYDDRLKWSDSSCIVHASPIVVSDLTVCNLRDLHPRLHEAGGLREQCVTVWRPIQVGFSLEWRGLCAYPTP